jgi:hypothetical protein
MTNEIPLLNLPEAETKNDGVPTEVIDQKDSDTFRGEENQVRSRIDSAAPITISNDNETSFNDRAMISQEDSAKTKNSDAAAEK